MQVISSPQHRWHTSGHTIPHGTMRSENEGNMPLPCSHALGEEEEEEKHQPQQKGFPSQLPDGWGTLTSREGHLYYVFYPTGKTQWEPPVFSQKDESKLDIEEPPPLPSHSYKGIDRAKLSDGDFYKSGEMDEVGKVDVCSVRDARSIKRSDLAPEVVQPQIDNAINLQQDWDGAVKPPLFTSVTSPLEERKWPEKRKEEEHEAMSEGKIKNEREEKAGDSSKPQEDVPKLSDTDGESRSRGPCLESPAVASEQYTEGTECTDASGSGGTKEGRMINETNLQYQQQWLELKQEEEQSPENHPQQPDAQINEQVPPPPPPPPAHVDQCILVNEQHLNVQQQAAKGEQPLNEREGKKNGVHISLLPPDSSSNWAPSSSHQDSDFQQYREQQYHRDQQLTHPQFHGQQPPYYQHEYLSQVHSGKMPVQECPGQFPARSPHSALQQEKTWQEPPKWQWERVLRQPQSMSKPGSGNTNDQMQSASPRQHQRLVGSPPVGTDSYWTLPRARQQQLGGFNVGEGVPQQGFQQGTGYTSETRDMKHIPPPNSYWTSPNMQQQQHGPSVIGTGMRMPYQQYTSPIYSPRPGGRLRNLVKSDVDNGNDLLSCTRTRVANTAAVAGINFANAAYKIGSKVKGTVSSISRSMATFLDGGQEQQLHEGLGDEGFIRMQGAPQSETRFYSQDQHYQPRQYPPTQEQSERKWNGYAATTEARPMRSQFGQVWGSLPSQPQQKHAGSHQGLSQYPADDSHQGPPPYIPDPRGGPLQEPQYVSAEQQQQHSNYNQGGPSQYSPGIQRLGQQEQ